MVEKATTTINVARIREDFPVLKRQVNGKPLIYFDNAATSQKPKAVIDSLDQYYREYNANIHRGIHKLAEEATLAHEEAREKVAKFVNARRTEEIVFTRNATEAMNLVAQSWGRANVAKDDKIVLTIMEHHSNIVPWQMLAKEKGARVEYIKIDENGKLRQNEIEQLIDQKTKIVCVAQASNVLGTVNPIREIGKIAHRNGALLLVDAAQSVPHMAVDVRDMDCDFAAFSGHKMLGPMGIGVLYGKSDLLREMPPFLTGGEMIKEVHTSGATWKEIPFKFEAGTPNVSGAIGLGAAVDYLRGIGMKNVHDYENEITNYALDKMNQVGGLVLYGPKDIANRVGVISFNLGDIHAHDLASILDEDGIAIRSGQQCAGPLMDFLNIPAASRASFYIYNTKEEVDVFITALEKARKLFAR
ncbi:MAG TPA: cysteine desulfurase [Terriglobales bacterium]|nr:cysteine desulfurase [Terriglobales bacterium]